MKVASKFYRGKFIPLYAILIMAILASCQPTVNNIPASTTQDIFTTLSSTTNYDIFSAAIVKAGLSDSLKNGKGPYTIFAPGDQFFSFYGIKTAADLNLISTDSIKKIVNYHLVKGYFSTNQMPQGPDSAVLTTGGYPQYYTHGFSPSGSEFIFVNGTSINPPGNFHCTNGLIQVINGILNPPTTTISGTIQKLPALHLLNAAIVHSNLQATLSGTTSYTIFAPSDSAFAVAGYKTVQDINNADPVVLGKLISYQIIQGQKYSSDLIDGSNLLTLNGEKIMVNLGNYITITGVKNSTASTVETSNIAASNGVIYIINQVLTP